LPASAYNWMHKQTALKEVSRMAKKDDGHRDTKKGKESER
jgi:hypothetical protein